MFKTLIIAWAARNIDTLIEFLMDLDKKLDAHVAAQNQMLEANLEEQTRLAQEARVIEQRRAMTANLQSGLRNVTSNTAA